MDGKATFHSQSASGDIDHLKITGGVGIFHKESAAVPSVNTTALPRIYLGRRSLDGKATFQSESLST
jgi:hypothetical protein